MEQNKQTKREALKSLCNRLCDAAKKAGNVEIKCNYLLKVYYLRKYSSSMLKTFDQWSKDGFTIKKDATGKPFWGAPIEKEKDGQIIRFCPINYWFTEMDIVEQDKLPLC